jgi:hypothetical protein
LLPITPREFESKTLIVDDYVSRYQAIADANPKVINYGPDVWTRWRGILPPSAGGSVHLGSPGYKWIADIIADQIIY